MQGGQTPLVGHCCPGCFMVVVYGTPKEKVDCPTCRLRAVPNKALTEPQSNTQVITWNGRI